MGDVCAALRATLVHECQVGTEIGSQVLLHSFGNLDSSCIWRDDHWIFSVFTNVFFNHWDSGEVINWTIKETLDLATVEVNRNHALSAGSFEKISDQTGRDRLTTFGLAVLAGVTVKRAHGSNALG